MMMHTGKNEILLFCSLHVFSLLVLTNPFSYREQAEQLLEDIQEQLHVEDGIEELSGNISTWAESLSRAPSTITKWIKIQGITIEFLNTAYSNNNKEELIAANILHNLHVEYTWLYKNLYFYKKRAVKFCNRAPDVTLEDSFAHNIVSSIFEAVFQFDSLLSYQW